MTVKELREALAGYDDDKLVVISSDAEGNMFSPLNEIDDNSAYDGEGCGIRELTADLKRQGYTEEDINPGEPCIVIFPV